MAFIAFSCAASVTEIKPLLSPSSFRYVTDRRPTTNSTMICVAEAVDGAAEASCGRGQVQIKLSAEVYSVPVVVVNS
jgi:hypothetical protein